MGLAATQARYLGLTARKTNVEYEGQQVNQQRTALANESSNLYNQLYSLNVPTPPSVTDYYKTDYSYSIGSTEYDINSYTKEDDSDTYTLNITYSGYQKVGSKATTEGTLVRNSDGTYSVKTSSGSSEYVLNPEDAEENEVIDKAQGRTTAGKYCSYTDDTTNTTYYFDTDWLAEQSDNYQGELNRYYITQEIQDITEDRTGCSLTFDSNGNISYVVDPSITQTSISVTATQDQDTDAYNQAMNQYTYDKQVYEKTLADINSQTEQIQAEDRSLELRLRQLDTEQESLSTEMESLKSVLDKNLEAVFKVFA
jgi:hypothetical protein